MYVLENPAMTKDKDIEVYVSNFLTMLEEQYTLYQHMLSVLEREQKALVNADINLFSCIEKEKDTLILEAKILEEGRKRTLGDLQDALGILKADLTLSEICCYLKDQNDVKYIKEFQDKFVHLITKIDDINRANASLIEHAISYARGLYTFLIDTMKPQGIYSKNGEIQRKSTTTGFTNTL